MARERREIIDDKGQEPVQKTIRLSRNGPIVDEILPAQAKSESQWQNGKAGPSRIPFPQIQAWLLIGGGSEVKLHFGRRFRPAELEHLILSHHGSRENGSPVEPMTVEAFILAAADDLDSKIHQVRRHIADDDSDGRFTSYHRRLERVFLKT